MSTPNMIQRKRNSPDPRLQRLQDSAAEAAALMHALGNPKRLLVLCHLLMHGETTVGAIGEAVDLSPSALSQHLARMREEGLVAYRREAQTLYYRIDDPKVVRLIGLLKDLFCP